MSASPPACRLPPLLVGVRAEAVVDRGDRAERATDLSDRTDHTADSLVGFGITIVRGAAGVAVAAAMAALAAL